MNPSGLFASGYSGAHYANSLAASSSCLTEPVPLQQPDWQRTGACALGPAAPMHRIAPSVSSHSRHLSERPWSGPAEHQMRLSVAEHMEPALHNTVRQANKLKMQVAKLTRQNRALSLALSRLHSAQVALAEAEGGPAGARAADEFSDLIASL